MSRHPFAWSRVVLLALMLGAACGEADDGGEERGETSSTTVGGGGAATARARELTVSLDELPEGWKEIRSEISESSDPSACLLDVGDDGLVDAVASTGFQTEAGSDQQNLSSLGIVTTSADVAAGALERVADGTVAACLEGNVEAAFASVGAAVSDLQVSHRRVEVAQGMAAATSVSATVSAGGQVAGVVQEQLVIVKGTEMAVIGLTSVDAPLPDDVRSAALEAVTAALG